MPRVKRGTLRGMSPPVCTPLTIPLTAPCFTLFQQRASLSLPKSEIFLDFIPIPNAFLR